MDVINSVHDWVWEWIKRLIRGFYGYITGGLLCWMTRATVYGQNALWFSEISSRFQNAWLSKASTLSTTPIHREYTSPSMVRWMIVDEAPRIWKDRHWQTLFYQYMSSLSGKVMQLYCEYFIIFHTNVQVRRFIVDSFFTLAITPTSRPPQPCSQLLPSQKQRLYLHYSYSSSFYYYHHFKYYDYCDHVRSRLGEIVVSIFGAAVLILITFTASRIAIIWARYRYALVFPLWSQRVLLILDWTQ